MDRNFPALSVEQVSKADLRRYCTWLQPVMQDAPTKTEVLCLNMRPKDKNLRECENSPVLFPSAQRAGREFYKPSFEGLKTRIFYERRIPVGLLGLLSGKSSKELANSVACPILSKDRIGMQIPSRRRSYDRVVRMAQWQSLDRKLASFSTLGNVVGSDSAAHTANRFSVLNRAQSI